MPKWLSAAVTAGAALLAMSAAGLFGGAPHVRSGVTSQPVDRVPESNPRVVGVSGCASTGCHGGSAINSLTGNWDDRSWAGAAAHWLAVDPHTQAFQALETPLATAIMERFAPGVKATDDSRCLACHTNPSLARPEANARERQLRIDGVSCEACHGDAGQWMPLHTTWTPENRGAGYDASGMTKLFDLGTRAATCTGCHVGAPADEARGLPVRDMNHDMIAAGHPRLYFDFADSQRRLPPHWQESDRSPEFELRAWLVGRAVQEESVAKLSQDREARGRNGAAPWPEFAESRCVSCHHKLEDGFPSRDGRPSPQLIWPARLDRSRFTAASGEECRAAVDEVLRSVVVDELDADFASQVYHGLAARERFRMKRDGRTTFDAAFTRLAQSLTKPRGNIDFHVESDARTSLKALLK